MKKLLLFTLLAVVSISLTAQEVLFNEPFDSQTELPAGWTNIDADGDTYVWYADWYEGDVLETYAVSESWNEDPLTPDNYLVSPQIDLRNVTAPAVLYWTIGVGDEEWPAEKYQVNISTTTPTVDGFTNSVFEEILEADAYYWNKRQIDISSFVGQQIYIAWRHYDCSDNYKLLLDSVRIDVADIVKTNDLTQDNFRIYPNPVINDLYLDNVKANHVVIYNLLGESILERQIIANKPINVSSLRKGVYFASFYMNDQIVCTRKIVKK